MSNLQKRPLATTFDGQDATLISLTDTTECRISGNRYTLILTTNGYSLAFVDKKYALKKGDILIVKAGFPFTLKKASDGNNGTFAITIESDRVINYLSHSAPLKNFLEQKNAILSSLSSATTEYLTHLLSDKNNFSSDNTDLLFTVIGSIFFDLSREFAVFEFGKKIEDFALYMQKLADKNHYASARIYDIYKDYPCSHTALINAFSSITGKAPIDYIAKKRIDFAKELLENTNLSIKEVSEVLAYKSASHFIKKFKNETGSTPLAYKNKSLD